MMWFSRQERRARARHGGKRRGIFGGEMKTKEEIETLTDAIEAHEEEEKKKADMDLEKEWKDV